MKEWKRKKNKRKTIPGCLATFGGHVLQVWVGCARSGRSSRGSTRMGCDHGLQVGEAATRSAPVGLLHPHGQNHDFKVGFLNKVRLCFYGNYKLACTVFFLNIPIYLTLNANVK